jgi:hypothetical protein
MKKDKGIFKQFLRDRQMVIYMEAHDTKIRDSIIKWDLEDWLMIQMPVVPSEFHDLPNYKLAQEIKNSPLYKAMEEDDDK